jgi:hypothetical protein
MNRVIILFIIFTIFMLFMLLKAAYYTAEISARLRVTLSGVGPRHAAQVVLGAFLSALKTVVGHKAGIS